MANAFQTTGFQHPGFQVTVGFVPPVTPAKTGAGGAARKHRSRIVVEIDGEEFLVRSEEEAHALLMQTQALAKQQSEIAAKAALNRARKIRRKTGGLRLPALEVAVPEIRLKTPEASPEVAAMIAASQRAIDEIYLKAAQIVEMAYLARLERDRQDDEDVIALLLLG